jgi:Cu/Ag efflux protein CusF
MKSLCLAAALIAAALAPAASAQTMPHQHGAPVAQAASNQLFDGEVRRVNREMNRVTLKHGPLPAFGMGAMTMAFPVADPKLLASIKDGDKVKFALKQQGDNLVVTRIEPVK